MVKSIWVVNVDVHYCFDYYRGSMRQQKLFPSLKEAFAYYKEEKKYDMDWGEHSRKTRIFHVFKFKNEDVIKQAKRRYEKKGKTKKQGK